MLDSLHIKNFRCFEDLTIPSLGRVNLIVGKNSVGKSTLLEAVYVFARRGNPLAFHHILTHRNEIFRQDEQLKDIFFKRECPKEQEYLSIANNNESDEVFAYCDKENTGNILTGYIKDDNTFIHQFANWKIKKNTIEYAYQFVTSNLESEDYLAYLWDEIAINSEDEEIKKSLQIIITDMVNLIFVKSPNEDQKERIAITKIKGQAKGIPLKSYGEGVSRLLQIFLHALQARHGFLLIDEFENGLHDPNQEEVWEKLFKIAKELDIQVFATTHSEDAIKAFCKVALRSPEEGHLISLGRSAYGEDKGKIIAVAHDENDLQYILDTGMEVR